MKHRVCAVLMTGALIMTPIAGADVLPTTPERDPEAWANPLVRAGEDEKDISVDLVSATGNGDIGTDKDLTAALRVSNRSEEQLSGIVIEPHFAGAVGSASGVRHAMAADPSQYSNTADPVDVDVSVGPGESTTVTVKLPAGFAPPGSYPVLFAISGTTDTENFYTTERLMVTIRPPEPDTDDAPGATMILPLVEKLPIVPGETGEAPEEAPLLLDDDSVANSLREGGRLERLLTTYEAIAQDQGSCIAVDPALVNVVNRMTGGYTVAGTRPELTEPTLRLRDTWRRPEEHVDGVPGSGGAAATAWLERLRRLAETTCLVDLPWGNADLNAVHHTGNTWLMREALEQGRKTIQDTLHVTPTTPVVIPGSGYINQDTAPSLGWASPDSDVVGDGGLEQAWEAEGDRVRPQETPSDSTSALDAPMPGDTPLLPPAQHAPVTVLAAENTIPSAKAASVSSGINLVPFQGSLAATLAATGAHPETTGYSDPATRYDYRLDSRVARDIIAAQSLRLTIGEHGTDEHIMVMPPSDVDADTMNALHAVLQDAYDNHSAHPIGLKEHLEDATRDIEEAQGEPGSPFTDPSVLSDSEVLRASQQANYTDDLTSIMTNDERIALTRYGFTAPLRRDLLLALSTTGRRTIGGFSDHVDDVSVRLNHNLSVLQDLRHSVTVVPPGNVFTRSSESSPLLIVAKNGLPLPVNSRLAFDAQPGVSLQGPGELLLPARGSITVQFTADLPTNDLRTNLRLWLATPDGAAISAPVPIAVQTRAGVVTVASLLIIGAVIVVLGALFRVGRNRRKGREDTTSS